MTAAEVAETDSERRIFAELQWEYRFGDRHTAMTVLVCGAEPTEILDALGGALLTDRELAAPQEWSRYQDPIGDWHQDPCAAPTNDAGDTPAHHTQDGDR